MTNTYDPWVNTYLPPPPSLFSLLNILSIKLAQYLLDFYPSHLSYLQKHQYNQNPRQPTASPTSSIFHSRLPGTMSSLSFLQIQTRAAHPPKRSQNQPGKNAQVTTSCFSSTQASSPRSSIESSPAQSPFNDWARCSRCHRSVTVDGSLPSTPGVSFGTNSYYCQRCAKVVGFLA